METTDLSGSYKTVKGVAYMEWKPAWRQEEINYDGIGRIADLTQRLAVWNNLTVQKLRLRFSNKWGTEALILDHVTVGIQKGKNTPATSIVPVTIHGDTTIVINSGEELLSDEVMLTAVPGDWIAVSTYTQDAALPVGAVGFWNETLLTVKNITGDHTMEATIDSRTQKYYFDLLYRKLSITPFVIFGVCGIDAAGNESAMVIAAFGDSITHIGNWTSPFTKRLYELNKGMVSVINCGIAGNRLAKDYLPSELLPCNGKLFGPSGVKRFEQSVYRSGKVDIVIILIGVNDLLLPSTFPYRESPAEIQDMICGYQSLISIVRSHGSKLIFGLMTPFLSQKSTDSEKEANQKRMELNRWIRESSGADLVVSFDASVCDESGMYLRPECDSGDGLHPSPEGGRCMAEELLRVFPFIKPGTLKSR